MKFVITVPNLYISFADQEGFEALDERRALGVTESFQCHAIVAVPTLEISESLARKLIQLDLARFSCGNDRLVLKQSNIVKVHAREVWEYLDVSNQKDATTLYSSSVKEDTESHAGLILAMLKAVLSDRSDAIFEALK